MSATTTQAPRWIVRRRNSLGALCYRGFKTLRGAQRYAAKFPRTYQQTVILTAS